MRIPKETFSYPYPHPAVTTDVVVFTIIAGRLSTLLVRRANPPHQGEWALPGGFLDIDEDLDACAARELAEETGLGGVYLEQLYTFGATHRDPRERVISVTYYALIPQDSLATPRAASDAAAVAWHAFDALPPLAFDHEQIITMAHRRLVAKLDYSTIAFQFMPETFTLSELQCVYESLLNQKLDKRNFRKRILSLDLIAETGRSRRTGNHRPAREYRAKHPNTVEIIK
ncbi:MAG: NUDIX hydrolase [Gammaproteobacteria bacterium]|nr:NUDIX hydrolase [Gammaproteobacteria bacterium]MCP5430493.1 NUDIX hydrolase [Chromatiaceae bacterium]